MRIPRPSPAILVSIGAVVIASAGTATAAGLVGSRDIRRGAVQTRNLHHRAVTHGKIDGNAITSGKIKNGTVRGRDLSAAPHKALVRALHGGGGSSSSSSTTTVYEAQRTSGPAISDGGKIVGVATLHVPAGAYFITADATLEPNGFKALLGSLTGHCILDAGGVASDGFAFLGIQGGAGPGSIHTQITRTVSKPFDITLGCGLTGSGGNVAASSVIAIPVSNINLSHVSGTH